MTPTDYAKLQDRPSIGADGDPAEKTDVASLLGTWINTNTETSGITKAVLTRDADELRLRVFGAGDPQSYDWGEVIVTTVLTSGIDANHAISFTAQYDFGFLETELQTNLSKGLLIISSLNSFKDGSGRSNYFAREYFYMQPDAG